MLKFLFLDTPLGKIELRKNVLIVSNSADIHTDDLVSACNRQDVNCFRYNTDHFRMNGSIDWNILNQGILEIDGHSCSLKDINLLIYRRPKQVHRFRDDIEAWVGALLDNEWSVIEKAFSLFVQGNIVNKISASEIARNKLI